MTKKTNLNVVQTTVEHDLPISEIGFYRLKQVLEIIPVSSTTWWDGIKMGFYPEGIKLSARTTGWFKKDIHKLANDLAQAA